MLVRLAGALVVGALGTALTATPALAHHLHAELTGSSPAENASLATAPDRVELTFDEPVTLADHAIEVVGPGNVMWEVGEVTVAGSVVSAPVRASGPPGRYTIVYRVISDDGDEVRGSVRFTMTDSADSGPAGPTTTAPTGGSDGGTLRWIWLLGGAILLAALVVVTLRVRRPGR